MSDTELEAEPVGESTTTSTSAAMAAVGPTWRIENVYLEKDMAPYVQTICDMVRVDYRDALGQRSRIKDLNSQVSEIVDALGRDYQGNIKTEEPFSPIWIGAVSIVRYFEEYPTDLFMPASAQLLAISCDDMNFNEANSKFSSRSR